MVKRLKEQIENTSIFCKKYGVEGKWKCGSEGIKLTFDYNGKRMEEDFTTNFTEKRLPILMDTAVIMIEAKIEEAMLDEIGKGQETVWN